MGRFVTGLEASAFHVFENGAEQKVINFVPRTEPASMVIVWDDHAEIAALRDIVARLRTTYTEQYPEVRNAEARIAELDRGDQSAESARVLTSIQAIMDSTPGSRVSLIRIAENESIIEGVKSAATQLQGVPPERSAIVLVLDPASSPAGQIAVVDALGIPVYALGIAHTGTSVASIPGGGALPALVSEKGTAVPYPTVAAERIPASLAALASQLANQYILGYVPGGPDKPVTYRTMDVMLTEPVGLPHLTAHLGGSYYSSAR